jgi:transcriptional regulator with XRE-family HTH domain
MPVQGQLVAADPPGRKRAVRRTLRLAVPGGGAKARERVTVLNLSVSGMLIETAAHLAGGEVLQVELPHAGTVAASVVWVSDNLFGCHFHKPLPDAALSAAMLKGEPVPAPIEQPTGPIEHPAGSFAARLRRLRETAGLSLEQVARAVGVSRQSAWYWERGRSRPGRANIAALARALGIAERELFSTDPQAQDAGAQSLAALVADRKSEIARLAGTTEDKVRIIIQL